MRGFHRSVYAAALAGAVAALLFLGPIGVAVVMLRCCSDSTGPTLGAWIVLGVLLLVVVGLAALAAGFLAWLVRRLLARAG